MSDRNRPFAPRLAGSLLAVLALSIVSSLAAGDVEARLAGKRLVIDGDAGPDVVNILQAGDMTLVDPGGDTTVNGFSENAEFAGVSSIAIQGAGLTVTVNGVTIPKGITARLDGFSSLTVTNASSIGRSLRVRGDGDLTALTVAGDSSVAGGVSFRVRAEDSALAVADATIGRDLKRSARDGQHQVQIQVATIGRSLQLRSRDNSEELSPPFFVVDTMIGRDLVIRRRDHDGVLAPATINRVGVGRNFRFQTRDAVPQVSVIDTTIERDVSFKMRHNTFDAGPAGLAFGTTPSSVGRNLRIRGRDGLHVLGVEVLAPLPIDGRLSAQLGDGLNTIGLSDGSTVGKGISLRGGGDADMFVLALAAARSLKVNLGGGNNTLDVTGPIEGSVNVRAGDGNDFVDFGDATVGGKFRAKLGDGDNTLTEPGS